jgi:hypothetical protein
MEPIKISRKTYNAYKNEVKKASISPKAFSYIEI